MSKHLARRLGNSSVQTDQVSLGVWHSNGFGVFARAKPDWTAEKCICVWVKLGAFLAMPSLPASAFAKVSGPWGALAPRVKEGAVSNRLGGRWMVGALEGLVTCICRLDSALPQVAPLARTVCEHLAPEVLPRPLPEMLIFHFSASLLVSAFSSLVCIWGRAYLFPPSENV